MAPPEPEGVKSTAESPQVAKISDEFAAAAIERFCQFLQFETVSSLPPETGEYAKCAEWLMKELEATECFDSVFFLEESPDNSPVVVALWKGMDESLPVLLLNSHYDVVPAPLDAWTVPPFAALRKEGKIYARGTQDMKCVCMQYIEALRFLKQQDATWKPARNVYLTFVPDEGR